MQAARICKEYKLEVDWFNSKYSQKSEKYEILVLVGTVKRVKNTWCVRNTT